MKPCLWSVLIVLTALGAAGAQSQAQQPWPTKPIKVVVPIAPGSIVDAVPRVVFEQLAVQLGQPVVVENRPGAGQTLGTGAAAKSDPDGHTLLVNSSAHAIAPALHTNLSYHPARDFSAVIPLGMTPFVLVVPAQRAQKTVQELVRAAQEQPDKLSFSSPGVGSASHLSAERFRLSAKVSAVHVPFKGGVEAMTEVIAGRIDFAFIALGAALPHVREGKLTALAVNGPTRSDALPGVPTLGEAGFSNAENPTWLGLFVPARTPREIVATLHDETLKALQEPKVKARLAALGVEPLQLSSTAFDALVANDVAVNAALIRSIGIKPQ